MRTLHSYLARELAKTFVLTSVALTLLIVMGGGVANVFKAQGIGAREMATIFLFLAPVAVTIILPVAALFSATITYGRAAADNEMTASRAAGINIQRLFLSALVLGLLVTASTFYSWNLLLPHLSQRIEQLTRRDLPSIVKGQFQRNKALTFRNYRICADGFEELEGDRLPEKALEGHTYLLLTGVAFLELEQEQLARYGTADTTVIDFDRTTPTPEVTVILQGVRTFDVARGHAYEMQQQQLGPNEIPMPLKRKIKFQDLRTLSAYLDDPTQIPEMSDRLFRIKRGLMEQYLFEEIHEVFGERRPGAAYHLTGPDGATYEISSNLPPHRSQIDNAPTLFEATVIERSPDGTSRRIVAGRITFELQNTRDRERPLIIVRLSDRVKSRREPDGRTIEFESETLPAMKYRDQPSLVRQLGDFDPDRVLDPAYEGRPLPRKLADARKKLLRRARQFESEVLGEIHFRWSYSLSAVAVVLIGAMLGVVMRGGQVLTAFGISCVPTAFVVVASIVGRNLADRPDGAATAIAVMWGATGVTYLAAFIIGTRVLRR